MNSKVTNGKRGHYQPPEMMKGQVIRHATYALHFTPDPIHSMSCALGPLEQRSTAACDILFSLSLANAFKTLLSASRKLPQTRDLFFHTNHSQSVLKPEQIGSYTDVFGVGSCLLWLLSGGRTPAAQVLVLAAGVWGFSVYLGCA